MRRVSLLVLLVGLAVRGQDVPVYTDAALAAQWENWSWGSTIDFAATDLRAGAAGSSISVSSGAYSALSVKYDGGLLGGYAGMKFDIAGSNPDLTISLSSTADGTTSPSIPLSALSTAVNATAFTTLLINFKDLPGTGTALPNGTWDRITFQSGGETTTAYHLDNVVIVQQIVVTPEILSAEPLAENIIAVTSQGAVDFSKIAVQLNGKSVRVSNSTSYVPVGSPSKLITYLTLASNFAPGALVITSPTLSINYTLPAAQSMAIDKTKSTPISPLIYGVNFPVSASYIQDLGVTISRWGGNAVTAYNPAGQFTNAGNDWYFENRVASPPDADAWMGWVGGAGSGSLLTVPALDWVAKDATSYSYPVSVYGNQSSHDPYNANAGSGLYANGSYVTPTPSQTNAYTPWSVSQAVTWLQGLTHKPTLISIDNEIEITSNTHQDMHPNPMGYDEELARMLNYSLAIKTALPNTQIAMPSTCAWWYYWTSSIGYTDNAAHNNTDFIPWFLQQMAAAEKTHGKRLLDYLDLHYYFAPDVSANDAAAKALRLRMSRSLWDTTYVDESWIGQPGQQNHQPAPTIVQLIPRMKALINQYYPGTKLSLSEFDSTLDTDITGGLLTVDMLGIFGRSGLDSATYWATPDENGPVGLAYWLFRGFGTFFGASTAQVTLSTPNPDTQGVFAATDKNGTLSLVVVNKNPQVPVSFAVQKMPAGTYFVRHFGGAAGVAKWQGQVHIKTGSYIVVPAYTAAFFKQM
ncbi:unnamed protein product [Mycena citricolor]|uniref:Glycoside hydrolase family 44 catalytic domain-containing protein n=1 Tax=Mycena citricolor TaxID=2018698 RepID=A0AAD2K9B9_9AGAR|nr:unnamed protein product [Mycena citricolor]